MARGDVRPTVERHSRGSWGGGSSSYHYDDEGRGESLRLWEWFQAAYERSGYSSEWLMSMDDQTCYTLVKNSTSRFGLVDFVYSHPEGDTRARRLVIQKSDELTWNKFHQHLMEAYNRVREKLAQEQKERADKYQAEWAAQEVVREAQRAVVAREDWEQVAMVTEVTAGMLSSDLNQAFINKDRVGDSGDWIEETVDTFIDGSGFGYETQKATGIKIQITVSLDLSNSMYYNHIHLAAANAFRDIGMTLRSLKDEYPDDLYCALFTFSDDDYNGHGKACRGLDIFTRKPEHEHDFMALDYYRPSKIAGWYGTGPFDGTDTFISPLFQEIEGWEKEHSDPSAVKLDIVLTDAVLEHPRDIKEADAIQERRDGTLQSVFLNFMPEGDWLNSTMPKRCYQLKVDRDNISGMLRNIISEFVGAHL